MRGVSGTIPFKYLVVTRGSMAFYLIGTSSSTLADSNFALCGIFAVLN